MWRMEIMITTTICDDDDEQGGAWSQGKACTDHRPRAWKYNPGLHCDHHYYHYIQSSCLSLSYPITNVPIIQAKSLIEDTIRRNQSPLPREEVRPNDDDDDDKDDDRLWQTMTMMTMTRNGPDWGGSWKPLRRSRNKRLQEEHSCGWTGGAPSNHHQWYHCHLH